MTALALQQNISSDPKRNQLAASDPIASVWVNASAGSGKTTVLTKRVTRLLLSGVPPEKILCLTYTRAGAAEMANRVTETLSKWATCDDDVLCNDLDELQNVAPTNDQKKAARRLFARVLACAGGLRIRTIHSFCQEILSRFPIEAGLPPHFGLIDEQEQEVLGNEVLEDLLREAGEKPDQELAKALAVLVAGQGEAGFIPMLHEVMRARGRLTEATEQAGGAKNLIKQMRVLLQLEEGDTPESLRRELMQSLPEAKLKQLAAWLAQGTVTYTKRSQTLYSILETPPIKRGALFDAYRSVFLTKENMPFKDFGNKDLVKKYPEIDNISKHEATLLQLTLERIEAAEIACETESVLFFGGAFARSLAQRKAARAALDYDDLILCTEKLLCRKGIAPWILYKLDNGIEHILVDEAQDTSRAQWNIVQALTAEFHAGEGAQEKARTLFVVGDEKQSIFSFQNADPEAFLSRREFFSQRLSDAGNKLEKIGLHRSFRSAPAILNAVDTIFAIDAARAGVSPEPITHIASKNKDGSDKIGRVEVWPLLKPANEEGAADGEWILPTAHEEEHDPQAELTQQIALKIKGWLSRKEVLPGYDRPIAPSDIMILLRHRGRFADLMVRALKAHQVSVTGVDRMQLVSQLPVMDLLATLRFVLLPEDDLNLAALLRSPLLSLSEEQLMELAIGRKESLWQSLKAKALCVPQSRSDSPPLAGGVRGGVRDASTNSRSFIPDQPTPPLTPPARGGEPVWDCVMSDPYTVIHNYLTTKLAVADYSTPFAFLSQILNAPCPANATSGRKALWARLGAESLDPIDELLNEAQSFTNAHSPSLQNFLHWLTQSDTEIKRELDQGKGQGGGQVRIMTVHASKGLEAPIVFLPDTVAMPLPQRMPKFQWSPDGIPLFIARKPDFGVARDIWQRAYDKQMEEYRRLFYVALTRASNRLYIGGWLGKNGDSAPEGSWYGLAAALRLRHQEHLVVDNDGSPAPEMVFADEVTALAPPLKEAPYTIAETPLPDWALQRVELPISAIPTRKTADYSAATPDIAFARGRIIHRLLQSLPDIRPSHRTTAIDRFLSHPRHRLSPEQRQEIAGEVERLLQDETFAALFTSDSLVEAPLTGSIDGATVFRQVDRLCLRGEEVWVVDYKTNRPPPVRAEDIPESYRQQMNEYRLLLRGIYPDKRVRCFLLWTYAPRLMEVV